MKITFYHRLIINPDMYLIMIIDEGCRGSGARLAESAFSTGAAREARPQFLGLIHLLGSGGIGPGSRKQALSTRELLTAAKAYNSKLYNRSSIASCLTPITLLSVIIGLGEDPV